MLYDCFEGNVVCFVDRFDPAPFRCGLPVYRLYSEEVKQIVKEKYAVTFIVTPVRDNEGICDEIVRIYPKANAVTAESLVEHLWI